METTPTAEQKQATQETYNYAAALLITQKKKPEEVKNALLQKGLDHESASTVVSELQKQVLILGKKKAQNDIKYGGLICLAGLIITGVSYAAASGGGTYVVTWGAVIFGGLQFFRGLFNLSKYK